MKKTSLMVFYFIGSLLLLGVFGCSGPKEKPNSEEIRKNADQGMQELRMEEERHKP